MLFQENPLELFNIVFFKYYHCYLFIMIECTFPSYFLMSPALYPGFSGPWMPPSPLSSTLTACDCFLLPDLSFLCCCFRTTSAMKLRAIFTLRRFLSYTPSPHLVHALPQPAFIKVSLGAGSSSLKVAEVLTVVWRTDQVPLFVWITQCSGKGRFYLCVRASCRILYQPVAGFATNF